MMLHGGDPASIINSSVNAQRSAFFAQAHQTMDDMTQTNPMVFFFNTNINFITKCIVSLLDSDSYWILMPCTQHLWERLWS